ncbi:MAG: VanW family protein [Clostridia bacterium]|nr:VanW family protein [Clostridia bacterium]
MMKRVLAFMMLLCLLATMPIVSFAEDVDDEEQPVTLQPDEAYETDETDPMVVRWSDNELPTPLGPQYPDLTLKDFNKKSEALYTCKMKANTSGYTERSIEASRVFRVGGDSVTAEVLYVDPLWIIARWKGELAYVKRHRIFDVVPVNAETTPPYGVQKHQYVATTCAETEVRVSMSHEDKYWVKLTPGTTLTIWKIIDGWAVVNYWRGYGYIDINDLTGLTPVSPTDEALYPDTPIAAYTSYYKMENTEKNANRLVNIDVGIQRMSVTLQPGEIYDCNKQMGPYKPDIGYLIAGTLSDGASTSGYGGGTCQVSSTIYNALLQLPGVTILQRRAHGENAAPYLPHGVDAAVGSDALNLRFRNDYDFPIRLEGHTNYDGALCWLIYRADIE